MAEFWQRVGLDDEPARVNRSELWMEHSYLLSVPFTNEGNSQYSSTSNRVRFYS